MAISPLKIAFISYEYPPDTADGGIATYVQQATRMLHERGHHVEVFAGSRERAYTSRQDGITTHRVEAIKRQEFAPRIAEVFAARHCEVGFDVLEGPDYLADAHEAVRRVPAIPLVLKLHSPRYLIETISNPLNPLQKARYAIGSRRRGLKPFWDPYAGQEQSHATQADEIDASCQAIANLVIRDWHLDPAKIAVIPHPYDPAPTLLEIPGDTTSNVITFLGRLQVLKGVLDLARAIPLVLKRHPQAKFRFVGRSTTLADGTMDMQTHLMKLLKPHGDSVEFPGPVPLHAIPEVLAATDICVFPSFWESFPNVCLESMAAARGIVGSSSGGMVEMLDFGKVGRLVRPKDYRGIAGAIIALLDDPAARMRLGQAARARVLLEYNPDRISALQIASYQRAMDRRQKLGPRQF